MFKSVYTTIGRLIREHGTCAILKLTIKDENGYFIRYQTCLASSAVSIAEELEDQGEYVWEVEPERKAQ